MSKTDNGGPAFPRPNSSYASSQTGMSLRDWFAGQALAGWLASYAADASHPVVAGSEYVVAGQAYKMADAMLAARKE